jgi:serine O-acetyltransferase
MMIVYRVMRCFRALGLTPVAMIMSRCIRHIYAAEIHWDAELAPGVAIVHGTGLVLSREAKVGSGCILFQSVTLGVSVDPVSREVGGPTLEDDVHVGPGAALLGPITIGRGTKIMANAVVMHSVPANSIVEIASATIRTRARGEPSGG